MSNLRENFALFRLADYVNQEDADECYLAFLSGTSKALILSVLRYAEFYGTRWFIDDPLLAGVLTDGEIDQIDDFVQLAIGEVIMACQIQQLFDDLGRVAGALEAIQAVQETMETHADTMVNTRMPDLIAATQTSMSSLDDLEELLNAILGILGGVPLVIS